MRLSENASLEQIVTNLASAEHAQTFCAVLNCTSVVGTDYSAATIFGNRLFCEWRFDVSLQKRVKHALCVVVSVQL